MMSGGKRGKEHWRLKTKIVSKASEKQNEED